MKTNKSNKTANRSVGRPKAAINWPNKKFTFADLVAVNTHVTPLCLRNTLKRDAALKKHSHIVKLDGELRDTESGKGRKLEVYTKRSRLNIGKETAAPVAKTVTVSVPAPVVAEVTTQPAPVEPVAEVVIAPVAETVPAGEVVTA